LSNRVIRTTFIISLIGHGLFLGVPTFNLNTPKLERPKELTLQIEIEKPSRLPKIEKMGERKTCESANRRIGESVNWQTNELANQPMSGRANGPTGERANRQTGKLTNEAMLRYQDMVKQRIEEVRRYPEWAKEQGIEGVAYLRFIVLANGNGQEIKLMRSSGSKVLDEEAIATIKRASPFPSFPKEIASPSIQMEVSLVFTLKE
jgi:protein TonB